MIGLRAKTLCPHMILVAGLICLRQTKLACTKIVDTKTVFVVLCRGRTFIPALSISEKLVDAWISGPMVLP